VPGYSDFEEDLHAFGKHFKDYENIDRVEILPYHSFGVHKYESLGQTYQLSHVKEDTPERILEVKALFERYFKNVWKQ
jgi:pyruvate formate lyase activating enzyme